MIWVGYRTGGSGPVVPCENYERGIEVSYRECQKCGTGVDVFSESVRNVQEALKYFQSVRTVQEALKNFTECQKCAIGFEVFSVSELFEKH